MLAPFRQVWGVDFEFSAPAGEMPSPVCLTARELRSGRTLQLWRDELLSHERPPYDISGDSLFVAFYAPAELLCHIALGWELPAHVLDLYAEFRCATNGRTLPTGSGLLGALAHHGISGIDAVEKEDMRDLVLRGGPWTDTERQAILRYNATDVDAIDGLMPAMTEGISWPHALLRGRYMKAVARMEAMGTPIDVGLLARLRTGWVQVRDQLISRVDEQYGVFEGTSFRRARFASWLRCHGIPWPTLPSGQLALDDDTFRAMARVYPDVAPLRELRVSLGQMRLENLAVGVDGRNRCMLSPFQSRTGRNQPSNAKFIFGPAAWLRGLIRPEPGWGMAYVDWEQQEFGIAAVLSGDAAMMDAYGSGDPYLRFAVQAGAAPPHATKRSHKRVREMYKQAALAVQYGMGAESLAGRVGSSDAEAAELLRTHRRTYPQYWSWSDMTLDRAMLTGRLETVFGWQLYTSSRANPRSLRNFPMQANGAEMLRLACCFATERGIRVCAPVHDAILIQARLDELEEAAAHTQAVMAEASAAVLGGYALRSDAKLIRHPDRYSDPRGEVMWRLVTDLLDTCTDAGLPANRRTPA
jgi:hypothetical protein